MNVSLPCSQKDHVRDQATRTGCTTPSEYVRRLIQEDQKAREREWLDRRLLEALESGESAEVTPEDWAEIRAAARARLEERLKSR